MVADPPCLNCTIDTILVVRRPGSRTCRSARGAMKQLLALPSLISPTPADPTHLRVGVTKLDRNVTLELVLEPNRLHSRYGLDRL